MAYSPPRDPTAVVGRRVVAFVIDALIASGISFAVVAAIRSQSYSGAPTGACQTLRDRGFSGTCMQFGSHVYLWNGNRIVWGWLLFAAISFANWVLLQGITGASVGKFVVGLRVIDRQGSVCGVGRAFLRWLLLLVDYVACFLIGLITVSVTRPHRRLGDMVASTDVVATADVGRPVTAALPVVAYAGWVPPGTAPPPPYGAVPPSAWGTPPPPAAPAWGAPPPPAQPTWGTSPPTWGDPPAAPVPPAPPPAEDQPGWGAPNQPVPPSEPIPRDEPIPPSAPAPAVSEPPSAELAPGESWWDRVNDEDDEPRM